MELPALEAAQRLAAGDLELIDVREPYEWEAGHVEGARHVPLERLAEVASELDRDRPVAFVCRVGGRSYMATQAFRQAGFDAYNVSGGMLAWERSGLPIAPDGGHVADH
jgi:rhodanese-related sulfurtransferase